MRQKHFIDSHKGNNFLAISGIMAWQGARDNPAFWFYPEFADSRKQTHWLASFLL